MLDYPPNTHNLQNNSGEAVICDLTLPFEGRYEGRDEILERYFNSQVDFVSLTVGSDNCGVAETIHHIASVRSYIDARNQKYVFVRSVEDIRKAKHEKKLAIGFHFQGSVALESDLNLVSLYYELGVRQMLLAYNQMNSAATGCHERVDAGLSLYGRRLVSEMNRVGMLVDCTHVGFRATMEMMELSTSPVIFSHSNSRKIWDHERNITDEQARACAQKGGLVGVTGVGKFMSKHGTAEVSDLLPHIKHFAELIGPDRVALGIDNVYFLEQHYRNVARNPDTWPKGYPSPPWHYFSPEQVPELKDCLMREGFSQRETNGILGENYLRVANQVWK